MLKYPNQYCEKYVQSNVALIKLMFTINILKNKMCKIKNLYYTFNNVVRSKNPIFSGNCYIKNKIKVHLALNHSETTSSFLYKLLVVFSKYNPSRSRSCGEIEKKCSLNHSGTT